VNNSELDIGLSKVADKGETNFVSVLYLCYLFFAYYLLLFGIGFGKNPKNYSTA